MKNEKFSLNFVVFTHVSSITEQKKNEIVSIWKIFSALEYLIWLLIFKLIWYNQMSGFLLYNNDSRVFKKPVRRNTLKQSAHAVESGFSNYLKNNEFIWGVLDTKASDATNHAKKSQKSEKKKEKERKRERGRSERERKMRRVWE